MNSGELGSETQVYLKPTFWEKQPKPGITQIQVWETPKPCKLKPRTQVWGSCVLYNLNCNALDCLHTESKMHTQRSNIDKHHTLHTLENQYHKPPVRITAILYRNPNLRTPNPFISKNPGLKNGAGFADPTVNTSLLYTTHIDDLSNEHTTRTVYVALFNTGMMQHYAVAR